MSLTSENTKKSTLFSGNLFKQLKKSKTRKGEEGFTLVELLVVLVILVLIVSIAGPRVIGYLGTSKTKTAKVQIESLSTSLELFKLDTGRYPTSQEGLSALIKRPANISIWNGPYLKKKALPQDPWGNSYVYKQPGDNGDFDLSSLGSDGQVGGEGEKQDINSWN